MKDPTDEMLMALADGALSTEEAANLQRQVDIDPELQARVDMYRQTRQAVANALKPIAAEPVPAELEAAIRAMIAKSASDTGTDASTADNVVAFKPKAQVPKEHNSWRFRMAASVAAAVAGVFGYMLGMQSSPQSSSGYLAAVGSPVAEELVSILSTSASGSETRIGESGVKVVATIKTQDGTVCREFEIATAASGQTTVGVACRDKANWRLDVAVAAAAADSGYAPASSFAVLDSYLSAVGASEPLSVDDEKAALK